MRIEPTRAKRTTRITRGTARMQCRKRQKKCAGNSWKYSRNYEIKGKHYEQSIVQFYTHTPPTVCTFNSLSYTSPTAQTHDFKDLRRTFHIVSPIYYLAELISRPYAKSSALIGCWTTEIFRLDQSVHYAFHSEPGRFGGKIFELI